MKRHTLSIYTAALLTMLGTALPLSAQNKSFTVNRNDGASQKYSYSQGDRLVLSRNSQGKEYADFVEQQVYVGNDVYNIPLTSIESITFDTQVTEDEGKTFTVQESGGKIEYGDITLDFPSGTFSSSTKVKIAELKAGEILGQDEASPYYNITMPVHTGSKFKISIKSTDKSGDIVMVAHVPSFSIHSYEVGNTDLFYDPIYNNGAYEVELPQFENPDDETATFAVGLGHAKTEDNSARTRVGIGSNFGRQFENVKWHYVISRSEETDIDTDEKLSILDDFILVALKNLKTTGIIKDEKEVKLYDISIKFEDRQAGDDGEYKNCVLGYTFGAVYINSKLLKAANDYQSLEWTLHHELFHYFSDLFDPRWFKAGWGKCTPWIMLIEAGGVWAEKFAGKGASDIVRNNCRKFVRGLYIDDLIAEGVYDDDMDAASTWYNPLTWYWTGDRRGKAWQSHGYGMSILLEYLSQKEGNKIVTDIFKAMSKAKDPYQCIKDAVNDKSLFNPLDFEYHQFLFKAAIGDLMPNLNYASMRIASSKASQDGDYKLKTDCFRFGVGINTFQIVSDYQNAAGEHSVKGKQIEIKEALDGVETEIYYLTSGSKKGTLDYTLLGTVMKNSSFVISDEQILYGLMPEPHDTSKKNATLMLVSHVPDNGKMHKSELTITLGDVIKIEPNTPLEFEAEGGTKTLTVKTNQPKWGVTKKGDWFKYSTSKNELTVTADPNTTSDPREGYLEIYALNEKNEKVSEPVTIKVTQKGMFTKIEVEPSKSLEFEAAGGTVTLTVTTNQPQWSITKKTGDWFNYSTSGNKLTVTAFANPTSDPRDGYLEICALNEKNEKVSEPVTIKVKQKAKVVVKLQMSLHINIALFDGRYEQDLKPIWVNLINDENKTEIVVNRNKDDDRYQVMCKGEDGEISFDSDVDIINDLDRLKSGKVEINNLSCMRDGRFSLVATGSSGNSYKEDENSITYGWDYGSIIYFHDTLTGATLPSPSGKWIVTGGISITRPK